MAGRRLVVAVPVTATITVLATGPAVAGTVGWEVSPTPNKGTGHNILSDVSGTSGGDIWAVGSYEVKPHVPTYPISAHWDGRQWRSIDVPAPAGMNNVVLSSVAAITPTDVWAVGHAGTTAGSGRQTLVTHWDGSAWRIVPSPNLGGGAGLNKLNAVAAVAPDDVWAVGYSHYDALSRPMVQHWDGRSWTVVAIPNPGPGHSQLSGVAARSADDVWAVGYAPSRSPGHTIEPYVLHWDGRSWTRVDTPNGGAEGTWLTDVAIAPTGEVFATGAWRWRTWAGSLTSKAAMMRFADKAWAYVNIPSYQYEGTSISDVAVGPDGEVWITGSSWTGEDFARLSGDTWQLVAGADPEMWAGPAHEAITVLDGRLWAVGSQVPSRDDLNSRTYAERSADLS